MMYKQYQILQRTWKEIGESGDDQCRGSDNHCPARFRPSTGAMSEEVEASRAYTL